MFPLPCLVGISILVWVCDYVMLGRESYTKKEQAIKKKKTPNKKKQHQKKRED